MQFFTFRQHLLFTNFCKYAIFRISKFLKFSYFHGGVDLMKVSSSNKALQTLTNKIKRNDIIFTHKLQRRENCWSTRQKALLIDSLLRGYPVNPVYLVTDEKQEVIDGVQRLSTCYSYVNNGFTLSKNLEPVKIGENTYEIRRKGDLRCCA